MHFELVQHLRAPVDAVEQALVDPRFLARLGQLPKLGSPKLIEQRDTGDRILQRVRYDFAGDLSASVKAVIDPSKLSWVEESTYDRTTHCTTIAIVPDHYPSLFECSATARIRTDPAGGTTLRTTTGEVSVRVPILGRKAEMGIVTGLHDHAELEAKEIDDWVAAESHGRGGG